MTFTLTSPPGFADIPNTVLQAEKPALGLHLITDWLLQVLDRTYGFGEGKVSLRVVDASEMARYGRYKIAPDGLDVWTSASDPEKARYMFLSEYTGLMSNGDLAPILG
jgi:hypothetical protein